MTGLAWIGVGIACAVILLLVLAVVRLRGLNHRVGSFSCAVQMGVAAGGRPRAGVAVYGAGRIDWWRCWSVSFRPGRSWRRDEIVIRGRELVDASDPASDYRVTCSCRGEELELFMAPDAYTGFASWMEAAPPSLRGVVV
ncbi:Protein of unknown function [Paraoerskovia marina]|uniref:DUF2550 domain-containing protein n=1 Tax=Paraoerskovia marina TaxID=545619 RepID=A0A1H1R5H2_9CELL|nr:DUF2550 domain-containing protein [Paraoerskovia marina]SDS30865.1 Protein of unknown function [Paraoerskovia marina]